MVGHRRAHHRAEPQRVDAEEFQVAEPTADTLEVATPSPFESANERAYTW